MKSAVGGGQGQIGNLHMKGITIRANSMESAVIGTKFRSEENYYNGIQIEK